MNHRKGITTTELVCAAILMSAVGLTLIPVFHWQSRQHRTSTEHLEAVAALGNVLDDVSERDYTAVSSEALSKIEVPEWIAAQLSDAQLTVTASESESGKRLTAQLTWNPSRGGPRSRVQLHTWVFPEAAQ